MRIELRLERAWFSCIVFKTNEILGPYAQDDEHPTRHAEVWDVNGHKRFLKLICPPFTTEAEVIGVALELSRAFHEFMERECKPILESIQYAGSFDFEGGALLRDYYKKRVVPSIVDTFDFPMQWDRAALAVVCKPAPSKKGGRL